MAINRFEVYLVNLDPTIGAEIQKTRPCLIVRGESAPLRRLRVAANGFP
jgi:mRNA-degrading endonuclease toxin of MazEF toxin-antitoxin module